MTLRLVPSQELSPQQLVESYYSRNLRCVFWEPSGDAKGPREEGWTAKTYPIGEYHEGYRVGLITGHEVEPGKYLTDVDLDWEPGAAIALRMLPPTGFMFGRSSKRISHCFYTLNEPTPSYRFEDIDKTCLLEIRGTKANGEIGFQTMVPPSEWSKEGKREQLAFVKYEALAHIEKASDLRYRLTLAAIGMLVARHLGVNGFGHDAHMCFAGLLLRAGVDREDVIALGESMSPYTNNLEVQDIRQAVNSTEVGLNSPNAKVKGGPALARLIGTKGKAVLARINEWLGRDSDYIRDNGVIIKDNQHNIRRAIGLLGHELNYNVFADKLLMDGQALEDRQMNSMWLRIDEEHRFRPTFMFFEKVVNRAAWDNEFHPVKQYLDSLVWDRQPRIDLWLVKTGGAQDSPYIRAVSSIVLIAAVRRIKQPGCKYDEMLVLEGAQGLNKSTALRSLCPHGDWFSDDLMLNATSQKMIESTLGKWIIEAADLAGKRKTEIEQLKAMLSRQVDGPARMAYAHLPLERARQFVIIGTTNSAAYLPDQTGARRFWPVKIQSFDVSKILLYRDQMWAEAVAREAKGESIRLPEHLWPEATKHQDNRREIDPWETTIRKTLLSTIPSGDDKRRIATDDIWAALPVTLDRRDRSGALRIADIMQRLGFKRTTVRVRENGKEHVQTGYVTEYIGMLELKEEEEME